MSDTQINEEELRELIEQWRKHPINVPSEYWKGKFNGLDSAADDLEQLIGENEQKGILG